MTISFQEAEGVWVAAARVTIRQTSGHSYSDISKPDTGLFTIGGAVISAVEKAAKHLSEAMLTIGVHPKVVLDKRQMLTLKMWLGTYPPPTTPVSGPPGLMQATRGADTRGDRGH